MMRARQHPCNRYGWLYCQPEHYQSAFDQQIRLVKDATKADPGFSGEPADMQPWSEQQLRELVSDPFYASQFQQHTEKLQGEADAVVQQLERTLHELAAKADALQAERHHLLTFLEGDD